MREVQNCVGRPSGAAIKCPQFLVRPVQQDVQALYTLLAARLPAHELAALRPANDAQQPGESLADALASPPDVCTPQDANALAPRRGVDGAVAGDDDLPGGGGQLINSADVGRQMGDGFLDTPADTIRAQSADQEALSEAVHASVSVGTAAQAPSRERHAPQQQAQHVAPADGTLHTAAAAAQPAMPEAESGDHDDDDDDNDGADWKMDHATDGLHKRQPIATAADVAEAPAVSAMPAWALNAKPALALQGAVLRSADTPAPAATVTTSTQPGSSAAGHHNNGTGRGKRGGRGRDAGRGRGKQHNNKNSDHGGRAQGRGVRKAGGTGAQGNGGKQRHRGGRLVRELAETVAAQGSNTVEVGYYAHVKQFEVEQRRKGAAGRGRSTRQSGVYGLDNGLSTDPK